MSMATPPTLLAVDIGGTFTDLVALDIASGRIAVEKLLTTYPDPSAAVLEGLACLLEKACLAPKSIRYVVHGTTLITNTLIERTGAKTALLATEGFRDAVEIGNEGRYDMYDLALKKPPPLAERRLRFDVPERMLADGRVWTPLDEARAREICATLRAEEIDAVAICFLHAYTNPAHELAALAIVSEELPEVSISVSHQVAPGMREYPRASTTIANAYVQPIIERYLERVEAGLKGRSIDAPLNIMLSSGGTTTVSAARAFPVRLVESGPAGGALAGLYWGRLLGEKDVLAFDMGGTTAKAALTRDGELSISHQSEVAHVHRFKRGSGLPLDGADDRDDRDRRRRRQHRPFESARLARGRSPERRQRAWSRLLWHRRDGSDCHRRRPAAGLSQPRLLRRRGHQAGYSGGAPVLCRFGGFAGSIAGTDGLGRTPTGQ